MRVPESFFDAIPAAATSPLALLAYFGALIAAVFLGVRYRRMRALGLLPAKDRAEALKRETVYGALRGGLSGEQWMRHARNQFLFQLALAAMGAILVVTIVAMTRPHGMIDNGSTRQQQVAEHLLRVVSNPVGAFVSVDGKWDGETPYQVKLPAGQYTVTIRKDGYKTITKLVRVPQQNVVSEILDAQ